MATMDAVMGQKDIISPKIGTYHMIQTWILDQVTGLPVGTRMEYSFASSQLGRPYDNDLKPYTAGSQQTVPQPQIPSKFLD